LMELEILVQEFDVEEKEEPPRREEEVFSE
jgi:hypothetical protein